MKATDKIAESNEISNKLRIRCVRAGFETFGDLIAIRDNALFNYFRFDIRSVNEVRDIRETLKPTIYEQPKTTQL